MGLIVINSNLKCCAAALVSGIDIDFAKPAKNFEKNVGVRIAYLVLRRKGERGLTVAKSRVRIYPTRLEQNLESFGLIRFNRMKYCGRLAKPWFIQIAGSSKQQLHGFTVAA